MRHQRAYFKWLVSNFCKDPDEMDFPYSCLVEQMYRKDYYFVIMNDENRAEDGTYLRWMYRTNHDGAVPEGPCSFLEFVIGVAIRLSEMLAEGAAIHPRYYFWELVSRLRLTDYTDERYGEEATMFVVDAIMTDFMDRKYGYDGCGGLFPLRRPHKNQTKQEVWYQLNAYLLENPEFFEVKV